MPSARKIISSMYQFNKTFATLGKTLPKRILWIFVSVSSACHPFHHRQPHAIHILSLHGPYLSKKRLLESLTSCFVGQRTSKYEFVLSFTTHRSTSRERSSHSVIHEGTTSNIGHSLYKGYRLFTNQIANPTRSIDLSCCRRPLF